MSLATKSEGFSAGVVLMVGGGIPGETSTVAIAIYDRVEAERAISLSREWEHRPEEKSVGLHPTVPSGRATATRVMHFDAGFMPSETARR